jgi:hypothetical protein
MSDHVALPTTDIDRAVRSAVRVRLDAFRAHLRGD